MTSLTLRLSPLFLACLALPACHDHAVEELADADDLLVTVTLLDDPAPGQRRVRAELGLADPGKCLQLGPSFQGTIGAIAATRVQGGFSDHDFGCDAPFLEWRVPIEPRLEAPVVSIRDDSAVVTVQLGDRLAPRVAELASPATGIVSAGSAISFTWSAALELRDGTFRVRLKPTSGDGASMAATVVDGRVQAIVPATAQLEGAGEACVVWSAGAPSARTSLVCEGASDCRLGGSASACVPVTFAR